MEPPCCRDCPRRQTASKLEKQVTPRAGQTKDVGKGDRVFGLEKEQFSVPDRELAEAALSS